MLPPLTTFIYSLLLKSFYLVIIMEPNANINKSLMKEQFINNGKGEYVKLNVGGSLFQTTIFTLTRVDCMLRAMFSGQLPVQKDQEGWVMIDRNGKHFAKILDFLRNNSVRLPDNADEVEELLTESIYYSIKELVGLCESKLKLLEKSDQLVYIISAEDDAALIIENSPKPVVLFTIFQYDKYADSFNMAQLLNNVKLFDNLCIRLNGRFKFVKKVAENTVCCRWTLYEHGKKVCDINCIGSEGGRIGFPQSEIYWTVIKLLTNKH
ncbi:BTB/POZ domain-containing adapter for CUL3-mediated RhoA degradation protein 2-like isoform X1 [Panonychus citri]|uniref:BTB/POZ domain-containing adapter for CUL3-mediated RhoA degradation protein 2-like isoform X1 n=1 Tax=Panonychus citri TaxID=50023 RepID=UPI0023076415|nr:BTB/POZ domain-containing adapter for CUL3-mediated RhoA degradation protein 2-like isoform X1 [Panonychus citri]